MWWVSYKRKGVRHEILSHNMVDIPTISHSQQPNPAAVVCLLLELRLLLGCDKTLNCNDLYLPL